MNVWTTSLNLVTPRGSFHTWVILCRSQVTLVQFKNYRKVWGEFMSSPYCPFAAEGKNATKLAAGATNSNVYWNTLPAICRNRHFIRNITRISFKLTVWISLKTRMHSSGGGSVQEGLCHGGFLSRGYLSRGVSFRETPSLWTEW